MRRKTYVLAMLPPPQTGQTIATERVAGILRSAGALGGLRDLTHPRQRKGLRPNPLGYLIHLARVVRAARAELRQLPCPILYIVPSDSRIGLCRDLSLVLALRGLVHQIVAHVHNGTYASFADTGLWRPVFRWFAKHVETFIFLSPRLAREIVPVQKVTIVPNTSDIVRLPGESPRGPLRVLYLSAMTEEKGWRVAVEAVNMARANGAPVVLTLAGPRTEGVSLDSIQDVLATHRDTTTRYVGVMEDREQVATVMSEHDVLLFPTQYRREAQPLVIIEAMSVGVPTIATNHAGIPDLIDDGHTGWLVEHPCPSAVAAILETLDRETCVAAGNQAKARYEAKYSMKEHAARILQVLGS